MSQATFRLATISLLVMLGVASVAIADHNSVWGEGWANMPNDIHNTRVDTLQSGDNDEFRDFVRQGGGADSVNRYEDGRAGRSGAGGMGSASGRGSGRR